MVLGASELSSMVWLVAAQFLLYAVGWVLYGQLLHGQRAPIVHWAGFMLAIGTGFVLAAQRSEPRLFWPFVGSNLLFLLGYTLLRRGLEGFFALPHADREHGAWLLLFGAGFVLAGPGQDTAALRVLLAYGCGLVILTRTLMRLYAVGVAEYGRGAFWLVSFPAWLLIGVFGVRVLQQVLEPQQSFEMHQLTASNRNMLYGYLLGAAMFNFSFMALVTTRLVSRLREQTRQDPLTGLPNRRALEDELRREWQRLQRSGQPFAVIALDLDHFKDVNDRHGHLAGDALLEQVAQRLRATARETDTVAHTGGEEFLVLMPQSGVEGALAAAQRLREAIGTQAFELEGEPVTLTVSLGVSTALQIDGEPRAVLRRADQALYRAKQEGRDRVALDEG